MEIDLDAPEEKDWDCEDFVVISGSIMCSQSDLLTQEVAQEIQYRDSFQSSIFSGQSTRRNALDWVAFQLATGLQSISLFHFDG